MNNHEAAWAEKDSETWLNSYVESATAPYRHAVTNALLPLRPIRTVLDVGCNCGTLMPAILAAEPKALVFGIDVNAAAIRTAKQQWPAHSWLCDSVTNWLPVWAANQWWFDVVTASSCLSCITPDAIGDVLSGIVRLTNKVVIQDVTTTARLQESRSSTGLIEWFYDYVARFDAFGWVETSSREWQQVETNRPAAVMTFRPKGDEPT